jgi:hypothetical protein
MSACVIAAHFKREALAGVPVEHRYSLQSSAVFDRIEEDVRAPHDSEGQVCVSRSCSRCFRDDAVYGFWAMVRPA